MNLDELRSVQSKERSKDSLQHLRESFYADVADYVADLRERRDRAADRADSPFDDPEVNRLTDEIHTAEEVVEAVYERRVGKVVKRASLAAAGMPADEEGLTSEEQDLFAELVETIEANKEAVLDVLAGEEAGLDLSGGASDGSASDGSPGSDSDEARPATAEASAVTDADATSESPSSGTAGSRDGGSDAGTTEAKVESDSDADPLAGLDERTTVRLTDDVGEIFGVDERTYDLASEDVVTLPEANAEPLVERGAAERLE